MLPDLIEARPTVKVGFDFSLPHDLFTTLSLIVKSPWRVGFSEWVYETAAALGPRGRAEVATLTPFLAEVVCGANAPLALLPASHPAWRDFAAFLAYLTEQPDAFYRDLTARFVDRVAESVGASPRHGEGREDLAGLLARYVAAQQARRGASAVYFDPALAVDLAQRPSALARALPHWMGHFGADFYQPRQACLAPLLQQALAYHRRQPYRGQLDDIFGAVTGRALPDESFPTLAQADNVVFVPSAHIGPYFFIVTTGATAYVSFNARTVGTGRQAEPATPDVVHLFPPLKALADETRLHILAQLQARDHTQESLMAALGISQPAASRHLGLLERTQLVQVRREMGVKVYTINRDTGRDLLTALGGFIS